MAARSWATTRGCPYRELIMIEKIIEYSARNRIIVLMVFGLIVAWGVWSVYKTPVDAIPDLDLER